MLFPVPGVFALLLLQLPLLLKCDYRFESLPVPLGVMWGYVRLRLSLPVPNSLEYVTLL